ncbi:hypothetical protein [Streptomyces sp. MUM 203J]|uniref:hypothetical protein n=1 Tax=Streptomyces sp. MUM 203J TaxID=2791990 RepID=UPI001F036B42|nr:hypothetical protein [Streptomyces sp. MUM 203J]
MARTAHHRARTRYRYDTHLATEMHGLRYSAAVLTDAARDGRRPPAGRPPPGHRPHLGARCPGPVRRPMGRRGGAQGAAAAAQPGRLLRALVNRPAGPLDAEAADAVDVPPARHRHHALWLS